VGVTHRKGKNGAPSARPSDPGSVWAIGSPEGGHKAVHPQLGTLEDFKRLLTKAREYGIDVALDIAYQCSPDHPYVREHPEWFRRRPDGTVQYAENPPKKYEDIYPFDFETPHWRELWEELKSIVDYWIEQGVRIFRVDNPHTKPFAFWEWMIGEIKQRHPEVIFLSEAFTRPKIMYRLAKLGFTHSYTYFAWRNTKQELTEYFTELTQSEVREYFRPHLWPNTPDILTEAFQTGGRPTFIARLVLAATLAGNYGIYGPAYELCENRALAPGKEEYLDAEKYEIKRWDVERPDSLNTLIARVNRARRQNPALARDAGLRFHELDNDQLIAYTKATDDLSSVILIVVNLDPRYTQSGWVTLPLEELGLEARQPYEVRDLLTDARYVWRGPRNYVELHPSTVPAHIFRVR
jgi:starch synthase (maltosyl-transferring)